jgi:hypothetical protein
VEENNIIAVYRYLAARVLITTTGNDHGSERIVPPVIPVIFPTSESRGIERAMPSGVSKLAPIPMAGGNNLSPLWKMGFIIRAISDIHILGPTGMWGDMSGVPSRIRTRRVVPGVT